jgi:eukaryotic-like serine/threonine-protein kinase
MTIAETHESCPRCGLTVPARALGACPRCLLAGLDEPEPLPESPPGLQLLEQIGRGGMGRVFRARHEKLDRLVAVKLLPPELADEASFRARFEREARTLARLSHPHIVAVYDFGALSDGAGYLVMEHVAGGTLRARSPLSLEAVERVIRELCGALAYAHDAGIVHRDIKPDNVLFDNAGRARLADFGIARLLVDEHTTLTAPHVVIGTPRYMPPEARIGAAADARADVYALGVLLAELLEGCPAGRRKTQLEALARRAAATLPERRFGSARELLAALEAGDALAPLPIEERSLVRAVALTLAGATAVSIFAILRSIAPRTLEASEALPLIVFDAERLADGRVATRARFETWPTLGAAAAWAVALVAYGLLRGHWRRAGLDMPSPEQPLDSVKPAIALTVVLNALFVLHLVLERTALRPYVIYLPIVGGILELFMVYLVWLTVLEAWRVSRPLRREPWLWAATLLALVPPATSSVRLMLGGQP